MLGDPIWAPHPLRTSTVDSPGAQHECHLTQLCSTGGATSLPDRSWESKENCVILTSIFSLVSSPLSDSYPQRKLLVHHTSMNERRLSPREQLSNEYP